MPHPSTPSSSVATVWDPAAGVGDWAMAGPSLQAGDDLASAVLISLFTDRLAGADDVLPEAAAGGPGDPRGWWGDPIQGEGGDSVPIGSKLWLLSRAKQTQATLEQARDAIGEALQWLIDDGVVGEVEVTTEWTRPRVLGARVALIRDGGRVFADRFDWAWQGVS